MPDRATALLDNFILECSDTAARRHLQRVLECGQNHLLFETPAGYQVAPMVCNSRWCENCCKNRSLTMALNLSNQFSPLFVQRYSLVDGIEKKWTERVTKDDLRHFVFTIKSVPYFKLRHVLDRFRIAIRQMTKMLQQDDAVYIWKIEINFNKYKVHPHIHLAVNKFYPIDYIHGFWRRNIKPYYSSIKFSKKVECSLYEFCKYTTKPKNWEDVEEKNFQFIWFALQRRRVIGVSRHLKLLPTTSPLGWILLGSLERLAYDDESDYKGIAMQLLVEMKDKKYIKADE